MCASDAQCGMGDRCAVRRGPRIGMLCDCGRATNCNSYLLKCIWRPEQDVLPPRLHRSPAFLPLPLACTSLSLSSRNSASIWEDVWTAALRQRLATLVIFLHRVEPALACQCCCDPSEEWRLTVSLCVFMWINSCSHTPLNLYLIFFDPNQQKNIVMLRSSKGCLRSSTLFLVLLLLRRCRKR